MLIIEIALGIVLAVLILAFRRHILAVGVVGLGVGAVGLGIAIGLAALVGVLVGAFWLWTSLAEEAGGSEKLSGIVLLGVFVVTLAIGAISQFNEKVRPRLEAAIRTDFVDALVAIGVAAMGVFIEWRIPFMLGGPLDTQVVVIAHLITIGFFTLAFFYFRRARRDYISVRQIRATYQDFNHPVS